MNDFLNRNPISVTLGGVFVESLIEIGWLIAFGNKPIPSSATLLVALLAVAFFLPWIISVTYLKTSWVNWLYFGAVSPAIIFGGFKRGSFISEPIQVYTAWALLCLFALALSPIFTTRVRRTRIRK